MNLIGPIGRLTGISDFRVAANHLLHQQWNKATTHALKGTIKAALAIGVMYLLASRWLSSLKLSTSADKKCEDFFAKGFEGSVACNAHDWEVISVPPIESSKYFLVPGESFDSPEGIRCTAVLTESGREMIPLSDKCREAWKIVSQRDSDVSATLWWSPGAKMWY